MSVTWTTVPLVEAVLGDAQTAKGYTETNIINRIERAEIDLRPLFVAALNPDEVNAWSTPDLTPPAVKTLVADLAALFILEHFGGQSRANKQDGKAAGLWDSIKMRIDGIKDGSYPLTDSAGEPVSGATNPPFSTTENKDPLFTMGNSGDDSTGSLDNY